MECFVPASANELYQKMLTWDNLRGYISYDEKSTRMTWSIAVDLILEISIYNGEGYVSVFDSAQPRALDLTHWHPDADVIYEEMLDINEGKIKFAYINTLFGKQIVYIGTPKNKKKHHLRIIHYLGEKNT